MKIEERARALLADGHTASDVAATLGLERTLDHDGDFDGMAVVLPDWAADDGNAEIGGIRASNGREAAQEYVDGGEWGEITETTWINVYAWRRGLALDDGAIEIVQVGRACHKIAIDPVEPECSADAHAWTQSSVRGNAGGVIIVERCTHCGLAKVTNTWAQDRETGEQGLESASYGTPELDEEAGLDS